MGTNTNQTNALPTAMTTLIPRVARTRWLLQNVPRRPTSTPTNILKPTSLLRKSMSLSLSTTCCCCSVEKKERVDKIKKAGNTDTGEQKKTDSDPRINDLGRAIEDDYATIRETYGRLSLWQSSWLEPS